MFETIALQPKVFRHSEKLVYWHQSENLPKKKIGEVQANQMNKRVERVNRKQYCLIVDDVD